MARTLKSEFLNIPNMLTFARIAAIPFVVWIMEESAGPDNSRSRLLCFVAALLFSLAAATDWFDGWLARNMGWTSLLGKLMDPLADKLIVMAALVTLTGLDRTPAWLVSLLLAREIAITGLRSIASSEGLSIDVIQAGKWKTALQLSGLIGLLVHFRYPIDFLFVQVDIDFHVLGLSLVAISLAFSLASAVAYFRSFLRAVGDKYRHAAE